MDELKKLLEKLPIVPLLLVVAAYYGYDYYTFENDPSSPLLQKQSQLETIKKDNEATQVKIKQAQDFFKSLEARKEELRKLALQLEELKASLSEEMDISSFVRMVVGEAQKLGMTVDSIRPTETHEAEFYVQQTFKMQFHGIYVQFVVFLQRLANLEKIIRIEKATLKPIAAANQNFVQLDGDIELNTYKYRGSQADTLGKGTTETPAPQSTPPQAAPPQPAQASGGGK